LSKLQSERKDLVITVVRAAKAMGKNSPLKLGPYQVSDAKVRRRKKKIVEKLNGKIRQEFPLILGDSRRIEELHELRKNCKKLRYTLEILPSEKEKNLIGVLRKWQTMLGDVRDNDITEQFIRENHLERDIEKIMADLQMVRDSKFRSFVQSAKVELVKPKSKFSVPLI